MDTNTKNTLLRMATMLDHLDSQSNAEMQYCLLSDAVFWTDEVPRESPDWLTEYSHILRFVFRYRTTLLLDAPDDRFKEIFIESQTLFPNWPGFQKDRLTKSDEFRSFYEETRKRVLNQCLHQ